MHSRHDLAWLSEAGWDDVLSQSSQPGLGLLARWRAEGWPLVVTRRTPGASPDTVFLGLAAPPQDGAKQRLALRAPRSAILRTRPAMPLEEALAGAPPAWLPALALLRTASHGLDLRVFGSLALQTITRQHYLSASSDIDLLFRPAGRAELRAGLDLLAGHAASLPLDGEMVFPNGAAVAWKEWLNAVRDGARVLVKDMRTVRLETTAALLATLKA